MTEPCQKCQVYPDGTVYRTACICPSPMAPEELLRGVAGLGGDIGDAVRDLLSEVEGLRPIAWRARLVAGGRPARGDRHVANALSVTGGPSPWQAAITAQWIVTGEDPNA